MTVAVSIVFLTPAAALVALAAILPLAGVARGGVLTRRARSVLHLPPPPRRIDLAAYGSLSATVVLLGLAAAQPVLARTSVRQIRSDAQVLFVVDISQSMAASASQGSQTRLARARMTAQRLRASIPDIEAGVATLTDRVLPALLPVADGESFDRTAARSIRIGEPPPRATGVRATDFAALEEVAVGNYFRPEATRRVVVLVTDGESRPVDEGRVARALANRGISVESVRIWRDRESIYDDAGTIDTSYHADPSGALVLARIATATGGTTFGEHQLDAATSSLRAALGAGPARAIGTRENDVVLAPLLAILALVPFALLFSWRSLKGRTFGEAISWR